MAEKVKLYKDSLAGLILRSRSLLFTASCRRRRRHRALTTVQIGGTFSGNFPVQRWAQMLAKALANNLTAIAKSWWCHTCIDLLYVRDKESLHSESQG